MPVRPTPRPVDIQHLPVTRDDLAQFRIQLCSEIIEQIKSIIAQSREQESSVLRMEGVVRQTGYKKSSIYQKVAAGTFPAPEPLDRNGGRAVGWRQEVIDAWKAGDWVAGQGAAPQVQESPPSQPRIGGQFARAAASHGGAQVEINP